MFARILLLLLLTATIATACANYPKGMLKVVGADPPPTCTIIAPITVFTYCGLCVPLLDNTTGCAPEEYPALIPLLSANGKEAAGLVQICFVPPGNPLCARNINVSASQVNTYLAQGSTLGPCNQACEIRRVFFGYNNPNACPITLTAGSPNNFVIGTNLGSTAVGQPSVFNSGLQLDAFSLLVSAGSNVVWEVTTPIINVTLCVIVNESVALDPCVSPCLNGSCFTPCIACAQGALLRNLLRTNACPGSPVYDIVIANLLTACSADLNCTVRCCVQDTCLLNGILGPLGGNPNYAGPLICITAAFVSLSALPLNVTVDAGLLDASEALIAANITCNLGCTDSSGASCVNNPLNCGGSLNLPCFVGCTACAVASVFVQVTLGQANCPNIPLLSYLLGQTALAAETIVCGLTSGCGTDPLCCNYAECVRNLAITLGAINSDVANIVNCANNLLANPNLIINASIGNLLTAANLTCLLDCTGAAQTCCLGQTCFDNCFCPIAAAFLLANDSLLVDVCLPSLLCPGSFYPITLATCLADCLLSPSGLCLDACKFQCFNATCPAVTTCFNNAIATVSTKYVTTCLDPCIGICLLRDEKKHHYWL
jgi:hypothetical protein